MEAHIVFQVWHYFQETSVIEEVKVKEKAMMIIKQYDQQQVWKEQ